MSSSEGNAPPAVDASSPLFKTSSTSVVNPAVDASSLPFNTSSTSVDATMTERNFAERQVSHVHSSSGEDDEFKTPEPGVPNPDIMDTETEDISSLQSPEVEMTSSTLRKDTATVTTRFPTVVKIEEDSSEEGEVRQSVEQPSSASKEPENAPSSWMDWSTPEDQWHNFKPLPEVPAYELLKLYSPMRGQHLSLEQLRRNAMTQLDQASTAAQAPTSSQPIKAMRHVVPLNDIHHMGRRLDAFIRCHHVDVNGQRVTFEAGSVARAKSSDYSLRCAIDAGKRGQPNLRISLAISPDPAVPIKAELVQDLGQYKVLSLRFPTGNYDGKHSIININRVPAEGDIQAVAQATVQAGGPTVPTWTLKFDTDFCFAEGFDDLDFLSEKGYSNELMNVIETLQSIRSGAQVELSFMLKGNEELLRNKTLVPFEKAVNAELPQFFQYRRLKSKKPIIDLNAENIMTVGENMFEDDKGKLKFRPWDPVLAFDDEDHYTITTAMGAVREHQYHGLDEQLLSHQWHKMYMVKPLAIEGKKNKMYQAYIVLSKDSNGVKFPVPAEGTKYRLQIEGREDRPEKEWQGTVVLHTPKELEQWDCRFDFVLYVERPKGGRMPNNVHSSFRDMAMNLDYGYSRVFLHTAHADVVAERPLSALRKIRDGQGPLRDAILGRQQPGLAQRPIYREVDSKGAKFLDTCQTLQDYWKLNQGQREAIDNALHNNLSLIQGPPGTGKTRTIGALTWLNVLAGNRVLACAASNKAVDGIARQLIETIPAGLYPHLKKIPIIRMHLPGSERQHVTEMGTRLEIADLVRADDDLDAATQVGTMEDLAKVLRAQSFKEDHWDMPEYSLAHAIVQLARMDERKYQDSNDPEDLCKDFRRILSMYDADAFISKEDQSLFHVQYKTMVHRVLDLAYIVIATCNNSANENLTSAYRPDVIIIDEGSQAAEIDTIIPIGNNLGAKRVVLVGDHKQLAPVVPSESQNEFSLQRYLSLFERLLRLGYPFTALTEQYRATPGIMDFYATHIYDGRLRTAATFQAHPTSDLVRKWAQRNYLIGKHEAIFIDVPNGVQEVESGSTSIQNTAEALVVVKVLLSLLVNNPDLEDDPSRPAIQPKDIGVIVLYKAQRTKILVELSRYKRERLDEVQVTDIETATEISTVDSFQGSERDIIISNFVVTSVSFKDNSGLSKFARDDRRLCVSMSRARYGLILVGNAEALQNAKPHKSSDSNPAPKISLVPGYHRERGSLVLDLTMDNSKGGQELLAQRKTERDIRQAAANVKGKERATTSAAATRELQPGATKLYELKHRQARPNVKRTAEGNHADDRGGKRPQQDYALQRALRESMASSQRGQGSFGGTLAPGTMGTVGPMPPMRQPPPGLSPGSAEVPLPRSRPSSPLPALPGTAGTAPEGAGQWDIQQAQAQRPAPPPQQGPPNKQTAQGRGGGKGKKNKKK